MSFVIPEIKSGVLEHSLLLQSNKLRMAFCIQGRVFLTSSTTGDRTEKDSWGEPCGGKEKLVNSVVFSESQAPSSNGRLEAVSKWASAMTSKGFLGLSCCRGDSSQLHQVLERI